MSIDVLRGAALILATASTGFVAAVFVHWSTTVMPALRSGDDQLFVTGFKALNDAILGPVFVGFGFCGSLVFLLLAGGLQLGSPNRSPLPWLAAALVLYVVAVVITVAVHFPLNAVIEGVDPSLIDDTAEIRERFRESRWVLWNHLRAAACTLSCASTLWALMLFARGLPSP